MGYFYKIIIPFTAKNLVSIKLLLIILLLSGSAVFAQCPTVTNLNQSFCDIQSPTIASLQAINNGGGIAWYATDTSTTPLTSGFGLVNGEDYFADNSSGNCGSRIRVVVTIYSAPTGQNFQGPCVDSPEQATIASLIAIGNNVQWYNVPSGGSPLPQSTVLIPNTIYYASQTNPDTGCQTSRLSVFVSIGVVPVPTGAAVQTFCQDPLNPPTVADLDASGDNNWYLTSSSALPLELDTPLIDGQTYYATTVDPPCESDERLEVLVSIQLPNDAGSDGIVSFCEDDLSTSLPINLFDSLGGSPFNTGIWSGPIVTSNGNLGTLDLSQLSLSGSPYVFTYSVNSSTECPPTSSTVTVIINEIPNAGTDGATIVCENDPSFDLFTLLGNDPEVGGSWSPALASGTGVFDPAQDTAGVYTYTIIGTPPCDNSSATITVTVNPIPNPGTAGSAPFCENGAPEDLFNYLGGTPDAGGTWSPALTSGTGVFDPAQDTAGVYTYTVNGIFPCDPQSTTVTVTINPIPNAGTSDAIVLCETDAAIDLFTLLGNNPEVGGSWSPALASGTGVFDPSQDTAGVYTYTIIGTPPCDNSSATITVTVNPIPNPGTAGSAPFCENGAPEDLFNYLGGTPDAGGTWSPPLASGTGVFDPAQDTAGVYTYTVNDLGPCDPQSTTVTVTINPIPNAGTSNAIVLCETDAAIDLFTLLGNNPEVGGSWSPALASGTGVFDPSQDTAGVYTYTIIGTPPCDNSSATITVTVNPIPNPGTAGVAPFCENGAPEDLFNYLGGTPDAGGTWSPPLASGTGIFDPAQDTAGVYTYTVNDLGPCDPQSTTVTVTINPIPNAGTSNAIVLCETDAVIDLFTLLGNNPEVGGSWSPALASGTGVFDPSQDTAGVYTYTIIGTPPCANSSASITVTVNPIPNPGTAGSAPFCENGVPEDLFNYLGGTPDAGGTWSPALASGTGVFDPTQDTAGVYTYTVNDLGPCDPQSTTVTVTINPIPNAGTSDAIVLCETDAAIDLFTLLGNNPEVGGSWSPALASGTGVFDPAQDAAGVYTYTIIGTPPCENSSATITVTVNPIPNPGTAGSAPFCENGAPEDLFNYLGGTPDAGGTWLPPLASGTGIFDPAQDTAGVYTYTVNDLGPCDPQSTTVTVTINPIPNAGTSDAIVLCETDAAIDLFTLLGNNPEVGGSWSPALASGTGVFDPAQDTAGVYTYTIIGTPPCENSSATITVTVNPIPNPGTASVAPFCENGAPEDLFNYLGGTPDAGGTWSPPLASGTGVFNPAEDTAGVYTYTVNGIFPCDPQSTTVTVTINPIPNAGTSNAIVLCETDAAIDLFTLLGNNPEVGGSWSPALASGTGVFDPAQDTAGVYTYTIIGTPPCDNSSATITVTVNPIPNPGTAGSAPFCENGAPEDLFNYLGGTPDAGGTWSPALASGTGVFDPAQDTAGVYTYTVNGIFPCDPQSTTVTVTINPIPNAGTSDAIVLCETDAAIDLFTLLGNNPEVGGSWSPALASGTGVFDPSQDTAGVYTYTIIGTPPCDNSSATITVTVNPIPNPGTAGSAPFCENGAPEDLFNYLGGTPDAGGTWSPPLASGTGIFDPAQDTAGVYTYTVNDLGPCDAQSTTVTVTINPIPNAGTSDAIVLCETDAAIDLFTLLGNNPEVGGSWSPALASGTGVFDPAQDTAGVYTYTIIGTPPCANSSASITVTVNPIPNPGTAGSAPFCENGAPEDLFNYLGGTPDAGGTWSPPLASGTGIFDPAQDTAGVYTYTVNDLGPCDPQSTTVTVTINPIPNAGTSDAIVLCETDAVIDLFTLLGNNPEVGGSWSPALASGTGVFDPAQDTAGVYTYTIIGTPPCDNSSATISVTVNPIPNPGTAGSAPFCENGAPEDLFNYLGGTPDVGGTWSPPLASGTGIFDPAQDTAGVYTYTVNDLGPCDPQSTTVTVTINPIPNAGTSDAIVLCETDAVIDLFTLLGNNPEVGGSWSPALASGTGVFDPAQDTAGVYTYTIIGTPPCDNSSATITVTVNPIPNPGTAGVAPFCENGVPEDLFNYLGGTPDVGGTWSPSLASGTGVFDPSQDPPGPYTYTVGGQGECNPQSTTVTVTINPIPNAGTDGATIVCITDPSFDLFTLLGNNPQTGGTWSPALASGTGIFDPAQDGADTYTYTITGTPPCANSTASVTVTIESTANAGTFTGIQSVCASEGTFDLNILLDGTQQTGGTWTDNQGDTVSNVIAITNLSPATYNYTYTVTTDCNTDSELVQLTIIQGTEILPEDVIVLSPICQGENSTVTIFNLADGNYSLNYSLTGSNTLDNQIVLFTVVDNEVSFDIDATQLSNPGTTTLVFNSILNTGTNCETVLIGLSFEIEILPLLALANTNLTVPNVCLGTPIIVQISGATNLTNGTYQFVYSIPNANPITGNSGDVVITDGAGQFTIPGSVFPTAGNYTLTFNSITSETLPCNNLNPAVSVSFEILPAATITEALVSLSAICANSDGTVSITNATNLSNGTYQVTYQITGAITHNDTISVEILDGVGSFIIPSNVLVSAGEITLSINQINSNIGNACGTPGHTFNSVTLTIENVETPELIEGGNSFCEDVNATIANLSNNIDSDQTIIWYDAPLNGNAYSDSTVLVDGQVYYASIQSSTGCESTIRLAVTVFISDCTDIIIPDGFSPNDDGINDFFVIKNIRTLYPNFDLEIFNRYGNILYKGNAASQDWDGTSDKGIQVGGNKLPAGVYFFIINFNDGIREPLQGRVYLSR